MVFFKQLLTILLNTIPVSVYQAIDTQNQIRRTHLCLRIAEPISSSPILLGHTAKIMFATKFTLRHTTMFAKVPINVYCNGLYVWIMLPIYCSCIPIVPLMMTIMSMASPRMRSNQIG